MSLARGDYVIMNDCDCPEAKLVAVLTRYDDKRGIWHALYLSTTTNMTAPYGPHPTPIAKFGKRLEWSGDTYKVVDSGEACVATYEDGMPRRWQDYHGDRAWSARKAAVAQCNKFAASAA